MVRGALARVLVVSVCAAAALLGCGKSASPAPTVSWYVDHPDAMQTKLAWCADDVPRQQTPECLNAAAAKGRLQLGKMKDEPPLNWNAPDPKKP